MNGAILENYGVEIAKTYINCGMEPFMYYYRDKDAKEIDIVLEHDGILNPIEIKKTSNPGRSLPEFSLSGSGVCAERKRGGCLYETGAGSIGSR